MGSRPDPPEPDHERDDAPGASTRKETLVLGTDPEAEGERPAPASRKETLLYRQPPNEEGQSEEPPGRAEPRTTRKGTVVLDDPSVEPPPTSQDPSSQPEAPPSTPSSGGRGRGQYDLARALEQAEEPAEGETRYRESRERLSQLTVSLRASIAGERKGTTIVELGTIAADVAAITERRLPPKIGWQLLVSGLAGTTLVALAVGVVLLRDQRWMVMPVVFLALLGIAIAGVLRGLPRLARRLGDQMLPGGLHVWLGGGSLSLLALTAAMTWGVTEATAQVAEATFPETYLDHPTEETEKPPATPDADASLKKGGRPTRARPGTLYVPESFSSDDGRFDLLLFFHGHRPLVQDAVEDAGLDALVHMTNLGVGGRPYKQAMAAPNTFDRIVERIEEEAEDQGLADARVNRVAIGTWSAGYGALFRILEDPERDTPIDAVIALDGLHGSFVGGDREVQPASVAPYVAFAREAMDGDKLFVITHSAITTTEYPSSTESADAILDTLGLERSPADTDEAPAPVGFDTAMQAFPGGDRRWLEPRTEVHVGDFHVMGYAGRKPADHVAHLAQMSTSALPLLIERWGE